MAFRIRMGIPEMVAFWNDLVARQRQGKLTRSDARFFKKLVKTLAYLQENPRHNSLASHEIDALSRKFGIKVFESYLENRIPAAGRVFWAYGPEKGDITILAIEPHQEDQKRGAYERIRLSALPE
ncbi:MAG: hypothetical protein ABSH20_09440 [Tepidisphaeraceae bacterium]